MAHQQPEKEPDYDPGALDASQGEPVPQTSGDLIGQVLEGRYRFDALVGEGTFARVFRVFDLHRRVYLAAKVLRSDIAHEPAFMERFRREARVLETLQHPNIVRYYDIVESGDTVFILTDFIAGDTLQNVLRRRGEPLSPVESLDYLTPLAAALHFAHREGIIHRDLKPANILIAENGNLFVTDFGIARILSDTSTLTVDTTVGTPHYMSPEQIMAGHVTATTDIYALGVMLYQMVTGRLPFTGDSKGASGTTAAVRIVYEHLHVKPVPPKQLNPSLSTAVESVILRCLEKDPTQRYQSVSDLYDALTEAIGTPSVSLDTAELARRAQAGAVPQVPAAPVQPDAERVPTGVGGASRIVPEDDLLADSGVIEGVPDEALPDAEDAYAGVGRWDRKRKRKLKREARRVRHAARRDPAELSEKDREKENEKRSQTDEKSEEKGEEKATQVTTEKGEFFADLSPNDRLSQFTWGGMVLWAGIVFLLGLSDPWSWVFSGAGGLVLLEVAARIVIPEYRARPGARLVLGVVLLMIGLGIGFSFATLWPLILIAIGVSLLVSRLTD